MPPAVLMSSYGKRLIIIAKLPADVVGKMGGTLTRRHAASRGRKLS